MQNAGSIPRWPVRAVDSAQVSPSTHRTRRDGFGSSWRSVRLTVACGRAQLCVRLARRSVQSHRPLFDISWRSRAEVVRV